MARTVQALRRWSIAQRWRHEAAVCDGRLRVRCDPSPGWSACDGALANRRSIRHLSATARQLGRTVTATYKAGIAGMYAAEVPREGLASRRLELSNDADRASDTCRSRGATKRRCARRSSAWRRSTAVTGTGCRAATHAAGMAAPTCWYTAVSKPMSVSMTGMSKKGSSCVISTPPMPFERSIQ